MQSHNNMAQESKRIRKIIHIDMDAFFASVEQHDYPELRHQPIAVGGGTSRGVVAAASYEARKFGVRSAMSGPLAKRLCPDLIFVKPRFDRYKEISNQIRTIFLEYTQWVEPLSLDEAYLDVTQNHYNLSSATLIAKEIRKKILNKTGLTASAGISINKFLAKIASDWNKPNGQKTIPPEEVLPFLAVLDVKKFHGVGKKTKAKLYQLGIYTGKDLSEQTEDQLQSHFGKMGRYLYCVARGEHHSEVKPHHTPKSVGVERTFEQNLSSEIFLEEKLKTLATLLEKRLHREKASGKTITLKIKYSDFVVQTRQKTLSFSIATAPLLLEQAKALLYQEKLANSVRLVGISLSQLRFKSSQKKESNPKEKENNERQIRLPF